jgi:hypothetical protein
MKFAFTLALAAIAALPLTASATNNDIYVSPYTRSDGSYVSGHYRSAPNGNPYDNYSTRGNTNPYTGQQGTRNPWR